MKVNIGDRVVINNIQHTIIKIIHNRVILEGHPVQYHTELLEWTGIYRTGFIFKVRVNDGNHSRRRKVRS